MQTKIQKWGNGLGLRIPRSFAAEAQVEEGATVDLTVESGRLLVRPLRVRKYASTALQPTRGVCSLLPRHLSREGIPLRGAAGGGR